MSTFDVWVVRFQTGAGVSPTEGLQRIFGIDAAAAAEVEQTVPRVVKHRVDSEAAEQMRRALESIGAVVECRPARPSRRVEEAVSRPPEGISVPTVAAAERLKMDSPLMGAAVVTGSLAMTGPASLPAPQARAARPAQPSPVPPMSQPGPTPGPAGGDSEPVEQTQASSESEAPESPLVKLDGYLDDLFGNRRRRCFAQAFAMIALAFIILFTGLGSGNSIFRGEADFWGVGSSGLSFWLLGLAGYELYTLMRG